MSLATAYSGKSRIQSLLIVALWLLLCCGGAISQVPQPPPPGHEQADFDGPPRPDGDFIAGPGRPGGPREKLKLVKQFDKDGDNRLNTAERKAAREFVRSEQAQGRGRRGPRFIRP